MNESPKVHEYYNKHKHEILRYISEDNIIISNKEIIDFYKQYKNLDIEKVNLIILNLYNGMLQSMTSEMDSHITNEILQNIKSYGLDMGQFKNELTNLITNNIEQYKNELSNMKILQNLTNTNLLSEINIIKDGLNKINTEITNSIITKFYDIRKEYVTDLELLIKHHNNESLLQMLQNSEKERETLINKTTQIIKDLIPSNHTQYYNQHELSIRNFKDDLNKSLIDLSKNVDYLKNDTSSDTLITEKLNILLTDKFNLLVSTVQKDLLNYIISSEERLKNSINTIKDTDLLKDITTEINNIKNEISLDKLNTTTTLQSSVLNLILTSEERIKNNINEIKDINNLNINSQTKLNEDIQKFVIQQKISSKKGEYSENMLENQLNLLFPSSEIINTTHNGLHGGDFILKRVNKETILFENKNYDNHINIPKREIEKFIYDVEQQNCSAIMISQNSGITNKQNFQIDIINNHILIYIHNMNYDQEKLLLACDIIDNLTNKLNQLNNNNDGIKISEKTLETINQQYQLFINKKQLMVNQLNEHNKKMINSLKELELTELNNILLTTFINTDNIVKCEYCNVYTTNKDNKKAMANHIRTCKINKNKSETKDNITESSEEQNTNENLIEQITDISPPESPSELPIKKNKKKQSKK